MNKSTKIWQALAGINKFEKKIDNFRKEITADLQ